MKCKNVIPKIMEGKRTPEVERHLAECPSCSMLANDVRDLRMSPDSLLMDPPGELDLAIRFAAASKLVSRGERRFSRFAVWFSAAAAAAVCGAFLFFSIPGRTVVPGSETTLAAIVEPSMPAEEPRTVWNSAELETEIASLSFDLDSTVSSARVIAQAESSSIYNYTF